MAITTLAGVQAGLHPIPGTFSKTYLNTNAQGAWESGWPGAGYPPVGALDTTTPGGVIRSSLSAPVTGQIYFPPASNNTYLAKFTFQTQVNTGGNVHLCDRLWDCGADNTGTKLSTTIITPQNISSNPWTGNRDATGGNNGVGIFIGLEVAANLGATINTGCTISYTNSAGLIGQTGTIVTSTSNSNANQFYPFSLAAGDVGVQSVQSITLVGSLVSGTFVLVAYREIVVVEYMPPPFFSGGDALSMNFPRMFDGSVPFILMDSNVAGAQNNTGTLLYTQG